MTAAETRRIKLWQNRIETEVGEIFEGRLLGDEVLGRDTTDDAEIARPLFVVLVKRHGRQRIRAD